MGKTPLRPFGGTVRTSIYAPMDRPPEMIPLVVSQINGGMNTSTDPADIPENDLVEAKNVRVRFDKTRRRPGTEDFGDTPPDSLPVLALYSFKQYDNTAKFIRFTEDGLHFDPDTWTSIPGTLNGNSSDRFSIATAFNQVVFSNKGIDPIQVIDFSVPSFGQLGNAPRYKYVTVFANRVIGAYYNESGVEDPIRVGWSANGLIDEWDPSTDISAGFGSIQESPGDLNDFITGVFGFTNVLILLRERSVMLGTKQAVATAPISFYTAVPGIGCGCPHSAAVVPGGLCFADHRTEKVYVYVPGQQPLAISTKVEKDIFRAINDPNAVFGSYDNRTTEYSLAIPLAGSDLVRVWVYNFRTQAWSYDERTNLSCIGDIEGAASELSIDELTGTIDGLTGTIDSLVGDMSSATSRLYGFTGGNIQLERSSETADNNIPFTATIVSRTWYLPVTDQYVARARYEVYCRRNTTFRLSYSKDGGKTWILARTDSITLLNEPVLIEWNRQVKCRKFTFKVETDNGDWDILDYELHVYRSGPSQSTAVGSI